MGQSPLKAAGGGCGLIIQERECPENVWRQGMLAVDNERSPRDAEEM